MNQINKKHFYSRQKGRALSMLVASREIYKVNRKRKREYAPYEVSKEETKEYQNKRSKPMNIKEAMIMMEDGKKTIKKSLKNSEE